MEIWFRVLRCLCDMNTESMLSRELCVSLDFGRSPSSRNINRGLLNARAVGTMKIHNYCELLSGYCELGGRSRGSYYLGVQGYAFSEIDRVLQLFAGRQVCPQVVLCNFADPRTSHLTFDLGEDCVRLGKRLRG